MDENLIGRFAMKQNQYVASLESITLKGYTNINEILELKSGKTITLREILLYSKDPDGYYFFNMIERASGNRIFLVYSKTENNQQKRRDIRSFMPQLKKELHEKVTQESLQKIIAPHDTIQTYTENTKPNETFTSALNAYANILLANPQENDSMAESNTLQKKNRFFITHHVPKSQTTQSSPTYAQITEQTSQEIPPKYDSEYNKNHSNPPELKNKHSINQMSSEETTFPDTITHQPKTKDNITNITTQLNNTINKIDQINTNHSKAMEKIATQDQNIQTIANVIEEFAHQFTNIGERQTKIEDQMTAQNQSIHKLTTTIEQLSQYIIKQPPPHTLNNPYPKYPHTT
jgi:hypothetical protein